MASFACGIKSGSLLSGFLVHQSPVPSLSHVPWIVVKPAHNCARVPSASNICPAGLAWTTPPVLYHVSAPVPALLGALPVSLCLHHSGFVAPWIPQPSALSCHPDSGMGQVVCYCEFLKRIASPVPGTVVGTKELFNECLWNKWTEGQCDRMDLREQSVLWKSLNPQFGFSIALPWAFLVTQMVKNLPALKETQVLSLGWEDPLDEEMATCSSVLAWRILQTEEADRLQSMGLQSQTWLSDFHFLFTFVLLEWLWANYMSEPCGVLLLFFSLYNRIVENASVRKWKGECLRK